MSNIENAVKLVQLMSDDNSCCLAATAHEIRDLSAALDRMALAGCTVTDEALDEMAAGEHTEVEERFSHFDGYAEASHFLNSIFERGHVECFSPYPPPKDVPSGVGSPP